MVECLAYTKKTSVGCPLYIHRSKWCRWEPRQRQHYAIWPSVVIVSNIAQSHALLQSKGERLRGTMYVQRDSISTQVSLRMPAQILWDWKLVLMRPKQQRKHNLSNFKNAIFFFPAPFLYNFHKTHAFLLQTGSKIEFRWEFNSINAPVSVLTTAFVGLDWFQHAHRPWSDQRCLYTR